MASPIAAVLPTASPPVTLHALLLGFQVGPLSLVSIGLEVAIVAAYLLGVRRLARRGRRWSPWRTAGFVSGVLVVFLATGSGIAAYDDKLFVMHVVQHLMLMSVAPIPIALGAPITLLLQAGSRGAQRRALAVLNSRVVVLATHPVVVWALFYGTMFAYFLTPIYGFSLVHPLVHDYSHLQFLVAGVLYWMPLVGLDRSRWQFPFPARMLSIATGVPFSAFLGISLMTEAVSVSPSHTLTDVHTGGAVLWVFGSLAFMVAIAVIFVQWYRQDARSAARVDRQADGKASYQE